MVKSNPHEVYNLAAMSFVGESWNTPEQTGDVTGLGVLRMLEAIREYGKDIKFYQASTSELYAVEWLRTQQKKPHHFILDHLMVLLNYMDIGLTKNYRESYDMFNVSGILFNHESERRGVEFVTRKITDGVAKIHLGLKDHIKLGNLDAKRDWGYSIDYVKSMWMMLQHDEPDDYVKGVEHSIRDFLDVAFECVDIEDWERFVIQDERFMRPAEVVLCGDSTKAREKLGWKPETSFKQMVSNMVGNDIDLLS